MSIIPTDEELAAIEAANAAGDHVEARRLLDKLGVPERPAVLANPDEVLADVLAPPVGHPRKHELRAARLVTALMEIDLALLGVRGTIVLAADSDLDRKG